MGSLVTRINVIGRAIVESFCDVSGLLFLKLFRIRKEGGKYEQALESFCQALVCWAELVEDCQDRGFYELIDGQEPVDTFIELMSREDTKWEAVRAYCETIVRLQREYADPLLVNRGDGKNLDG